MSPGRRRWPRNELARRTAALERQVEEWARSGRQSEVPLFALPEAPEPRLGHCESCAGPVPEGRWRCDLRQTVLLAQAIRPLAGGNGRGEPQGEDRLLTVEEAAKKLGLSTDWLYRRARKLPFTVRLGRRLRFSERGLDRYIRQRQGR